MRCRTALTTVLVPISVAMWAGPAPAAVRPREKGRRRTLLPGSTNFDRRTALQCAGQALALTFHDSRTWNASQRAGATSPRAPELSKSAQRTLPGSCGSVLEPHGVGTPSCATEIRIISVLCLFEVGSPGFAAAKDRLWIGHAACGQSLVLGCGELVASAEVSS